MASFAAVFEGERAAVLAACESKAAHGAKAAAQHAAKAHKPAWRAALYDGYKASATAAGAHMVHHLRDAGAPVPDGFEPDPETDDELGQWADDTAASISATNADRVGRVFDRLGDAAELAAILLALGGAYDTWMGAQDGGDPQACRASDIAGDAATAGWHFGETDTALALEDSSKALEATRTWTALGDARTRETHAEADGQEASTTETFAVGGDDLRFPGDPYGSPEETANCRCYLYWTFAWGGADVRPVGDIYDNADLATLGEE